MLVSTYIIGVFSSFLILALVYKSAYYRLLQTRQPLPGPSSIPQPTCQQKITKEFTYSTQWNTSKHLTSRADYGSRPNG